MKDIDLGLQLLAPTLTKILTLTAVLTLGVSAVKEELGTFLFRGWVTSALLVILHSDDTTGLTKWISLIGNLVIR